MDMLGMVILSLILGWFFFVFWGKRKSQMAALIASPTNTPHRMSCILMEKQTNKQTKKTLKRFLCVVSHFSLFIQCISKIPKGKKTCFFKPNKKKNKSKTEGQESAVCVVGTPAFWFTIHSSKQFKLILIIATWFAWVLLLFILNFFLFVLYFSFHPTLHRWLTWHGGGGLVG